MSTPRRKSAALLTALPLPTLAERVIAKGDPGAPGPPGPRGPSVLLEISESSSSELYGKHSPGFALVASGAEPIQCSFSGWDDLDILQLDFWCQLAVLDAYSGRHVIQAQLSTNGGSEWHGISGARVVCDGHSTSASSSIALPMPEGAFAPLVRLYVAHLASNEVDYGPGPEGATLLLRCVRWQRGTFGARGRLVPPRP